MNERIILPFLTACALLCSLGAFAQDDVSGNKERLKEIKAQRSAYITTKLGLSPSEAQEFWPIYNAFDDARDELRSGRRALQRPGEDKTVSLTEAQAKDMLARHHASRQEELDLERSYSERFVKSIGAVRTVALQKAENDFRREVLRNFKDRMGEPKGDGQGPPPRR
ncbi:MAG: hypothetical protein WEC15_01440 [Flavobacteriales bacterium]